MISKENKQLLLQYTAGIIGEPGFDSYFILLNENKLYFLFFFMGLFGFIPMFKLRGEVSCSVHFK